MAGKARSNKRYYRCNNVDKLVGSHTCAGSYITADRVEKAVWDTVSDSLRNPELLADQYRKQLADSSVSDEFELTGKQIALALKRVLVQENRMTDAYRNEAIELDRYKTEMNKLRERRTGLEKQQVELDLNYAHEKKREGALEHLERFCQNVSIGLGNLTFEERQQLLRLVVERVIVKDASVRVETIIPPDGQNTGLLGTRHPELDSGSLSPLAAAINVSTDQPVPLPAKLPAIPMRLSLSVPPALQYRDYRNFWFAMLSAVGGFQILTFGQFWLIHELTGSTLYLGYVGLASALPAITLNLVGGVVADRFNKVRLITVSQTASASLVLILALLTVTNVVEAWHVLAIAVVAGAVNAFNQPARQSLYPQLVDKSVMGSAVALNSSIWQGTRIMAPAVAGVLIAAFGTASAFFTAAGLMLVLSVVVNLLKVQEQTPKRSSSAIQDIGEGLTFIRTNPIFMFLISITFFNSFFGMSYIIMMPVFAKDILNVGAEGQGAMMMAGGLGSLVTGLWLGTKGTYDRKGFVLIGGAVMTGLTLAAFALTAEYIGSYPLAIVLMMMIGVFTSTYMISIMSSLQMLVPNEMRGRVMGFYGMTWNIMPLGGMFAGALAVQTGTHWAVAIGGFIVAAFALGPALLNSNVRNLGQTLKTAEQTTT